MRLVDVVNCQWGVRTKVIELGGPTFVLGLYQRSFSCLQPMNFG
ncbi:hypothetical protein ACVWYQ_003727 [Bradyrhizobium sp. USDA 3397]